MTSQKSVKIQVGDKVRYTRLPHTPDMIVSGTSEVYKRGEPKTAIPIAYCGWFDKNWTWCDGSFYFEDLEVQLPPGGEAAIKPDAPDEGNLRKTTNRARCFHCDEIVDTTKPHNCSAIQSGGERFVVEPPCDVERSE